MRDAMFHHRIEYLEKKLERKVTQYEWHKLLIFLNDMPCQQSFYEKVQNSVYAVLDEAEITMDELKAIK